MKKIFEGLNKEKQNFGILGGNIEILENNSRNILKFFIKNDYSSDTKLEIIKEANIHLNPINSLINIKLLTENDSKQEIIKEIEKFLKKYNEELNQIFKFQNAKNINIK